MESWLFDLNLIVVSLWRTRLRQLEKRGEKGGLESEIWTVDTRSRKTVYPPCALVVTYAGQIVTLTWRAHWTDSTRLHAKTFVNCKVFLDSSFVEVMQSAIRI